MGAYDMVDVDEAVQLIRDNDVKYEHTPRLAVLRRYINGEATAGGELVSVGYDGEGRPATLVMHFPDKPASSMLV